MLVQILLLIARAALLLGNNLNDALWSRVLRNRKLILG